MIILYAIYDHWAKDARIRGFTEWPEPGVPDVWTGTDGKQFGLWNGTDKYGVLCSTEEEFQEWLAERDLPASYTNEVLINNGEIRQFTEEPQ